MASREWPADRYNQGRAHANLSGFYESHHLTDNLPELKESLDVDERVEDLQENVYREEHEYKLRIFCIEIL